MTSEQKHDFWQQHIDAWQQGTLSQKSYCTEHHLSVANFSYWRKKLTHTSSPSQKLIPISTPNLSFAVKIFLPAGLILEIPAHSLSEMLPMVCRIVEERSNATS